MITLNLIANGIEQQKLKEYLENNVSEILAEKINNGVTITKDNKTLINKKDLKGFWSYATEEAKKIAEKGSRGAYVDDNTVYGWAIHYFEEESIEGTLYNEDGTEYKVEVKTPSKPATKVEKSNKKENNQQTLFDLMNVSENKTTKEEFEEAPIEFDEVEDNDIDDFTEKEIEEALDEVDKEMNAETQKETNSIDKELAIILYGLLDGKMEVK